MEVLKIVVICDDNKWNELFVEQISRCEFLEVAKIVTDYMGLDDAVSKIAPEILVADLDLLKATGFSYDYLNDRITSWEPKNPFIMAIGDEDHRDINKGIMRYGIDFWNNKSPEEGSVADVSRILDDIAPLLAEAKNKL